MRVCDMDQKPEANFQHEDVASHEDFERETSTPSGGQQRQAIEAFEGRALDLRTLLALLVSLAQNQQELFEILIRLQALAVTYEACLFSFALPANVLLSINKAVGPSASISWAPTSWALASAVVMTIAGRCSDIFGRRHYFLIGNLLGIIGCTVAGRCVQVLPLGSWRFG